MTQLIANSPRVDSLQRPSALEAAVVEPPVAPAPVAVEERPTPSPQTRGHAQQARKADLRAQHLEARLQKEVQARPRSEQTRETALKDFEGTAEVGALSPENRAKARHAVSATPFGTVATDRASMLREMMATDGFKQLSAVDQGKVLDLYPNLGPYPASELIGMSKNGRLYAADNSPDGKGRTLDHLHGLATKPLARGIDRDALLDATIRETANPGSIVQGNQRTSSVTSLSYSLADQQPGEYARLVAGLAGPGAEVKLANGHSIKGSQRSKGDDGSGRLSSSQILQPALIAYGGSKDPGKQGLDFNQMGHVAEAVFDKDYRRDVRTGNEDRTFPSGSIATLKTYGNASHAVTPVAIEDGRFYFRSPKGWWGASDGVVRLGTEVVARQETDPKDRGGRAPLVGLSSISLAELKAVAPEILMPK